MKKRIKKNKFKRYIAVFIRTIKRVNRKKILLWLKKNLKQHPFILGLLLFLWLDKIFISRNYGKNIPSLIKFHSYILIAWFLLVIISNVLKDKSKVKWYLKRRFVFVMLLLFPPLGLILLWSGAKFKRVTKIILSVIFVSVFFGQIYHSKKYEKKNPVEMIVDTISKPKKKIYLKKVDVGILRNLQFATLPKKTKSKLAVSDIATLGSSAVVSIKTKNKDGKELGLGSGFIVSRDGIIVTNFHVLESAYQAEIKIGENEFKEVYFIKGDPSLDIALLKVNAKNLSPLSIGDSDSLINGQFIVAVGNPWGFERSVSNGIVSGIRSQGDVKIIQMTAPVSPGSSGGPVINEYGEVVGVTTLASFLFAQNLNFAIPINNLQKLISEK